MCQPVHVVRTCSIELAGQPRAIGHNPAQELFAENEEVGEDLTVLYAVAANLRRQQSRTNRRPDAPPLNGR
ncbi:MAG: hypothetical protein ABIQ16_23445 [Polyangiaceae bacterium]